ncbi:MAG: FecR domain-containing protein [Desulfamplus sp.]|nr:FecR domain-containing protein [Desulfamplus sp.]
METELKLNRRDAIKTIISSTLVCATGVNVLGNSAYAMGKAEIPQGVQKVEGDVTINNITAKVGDILSPDDVIVTGKNSSVIFTFGDSSCLMRENSKLTVENSEKTGEKNKFINALRLIDGKLLSAFGKGDKTVETPSAYIGIRGTGLYVEADHKKTYVCACYGKITLRHVIYPSKEETITTKHHEYSRYIHHVEGNIVPAPMLNHTDDELAMLEELVRRIPPFISKSGKKDGGSGY